MQSSTEVFERLRARLEDGAFDNVTAYVAPPEEIGQQVFLPEIFAHE